MPAIRSTVDRDSSLYQSNYAAMQSSLERLRAELKRSTQGGGEKYVKRHIERGRLLPRDRVEMLLDEGSYFLEIAARWYRDGERVPRRGCDWRYWRGLRPRMRDRCQRSDRERWRHR